MAASAAAEPPERVPAEVWLTRYMAELGRAPGTADQLRAFAAHRGGALTYGAARRAVAQQASATSDAATASSASSSAHHHAPAPAAALAAAPSWDTSRPGRLSVSALAARFDHPSSTAPPPRITPPRRPRLSEAVQVALSSEALRAQLALLQPDLGSAAQESLFIQQLLVLVRDAEAQAEAQARASAEQAARRLQEVLPVARVDLETECSICLVSNDPVGWCKLPCGHVFHEQCILDWVRGAPRRACPLCRLDLDTAFQAEHAHVLAHAHEAAEAGRPPPDAASDAAYAAPPGPLPPQLLPPLAPEGPEDNDERSRRAQGPAQPGALRELRELELAREDLERMQHLSQSFREVQRSMASLSPDQRRSVLAVLGVAQGLADSPR